MSGPRPSFPASSAVSPRVALIGPAADGDLQLYAEAFRSLGTVSVLDPLVLGAGVVNRPILRRGQSFVDPATDFDAYFAPYLGPSRTRRALIDVFAAAGLPTINTTEAKEIAEDKWATACTLASAGLPQPRTLLVAGGPAVTERAQAARALGLPLVLKTQFGYGGSGVALAHQLADIERFVAEAGLGPDDGLLLQEFYAEAGHRDLRIVVLDGEVLAVKARWSGSDAEFRSAIPGNIVEIGYLESGERQMALAVVRALGLDFAGVDLIRASGGPVILELNNAPSLPQTQQVCRVDIALAVARALLARLAR